MDEPRCETCRHFDPAHSCIERPTWGHCRQAVSAGDKDSLGLFTWADDICEFTESRYEPNRLRPMSRITLIPNKRNFFDRLGRMSVQQDDIDEMNERVR